MKSCVSYCYTDALSVCTSVLSEEVVLMLSVMWRGFVTAAKLDTWMGVQPHGHEWKDTEISSRRVVLH